MANSVSLSVVEGRRYRASRETVFAAFTDPALIARWFSPSDDIATEVAGFDLRIGGRYRFGFRSPVEDFAYVGGVFVEITPPTRLVYTLMWEPPHPHAGMETLVTIELADHGGETELAVTHERFTTEEARGRHHAGWLGAFERLERLLAVSNKERGR